MESSGLSNSSSNDSPVHTHAPAYLRLNSEVVEKPGVNEECLDYVNRPPLQQPGVLVQSVPVSPAATTTSNKSENDGKLPVQTLHVSNRQIVTKNTLLLLICSMCGCRFE